MAASQKPIKRSHRDEPTYWFALLEIARDKNDREEIDECHRQLARLSVRVIYDRTSLESEVAHG